MTAENNEQRELNLRKGELDKGFNTLSFRLDQVNTNFSLAKRQGDESGVEAAIKELLRVNFSIGELREREAWMNALELTFGPSALLRVWNLKDQINDQRRTVENRDDPPQSQG